MKVCLACRSHNIHQEEHLILVAWVATVWVSGAKMRNLGHLDVKEFCEVDA